MTVTRAAVLQTVRRLGYPVGSGQLAQIMGETSYAVNKALIALYARDKIDRRPRLTGHRYLYFAKAAS